MSHSEHILIVDDDAEIRSLLADYLHKNGYRATAVSDGRGMEKALQQLRVDLLILDVMLPGTDGLSLCRNLRKSSPLPVILLTARDEDVDRIVGFELGADDYVAKPFNPRELLMRIRAVLRRAAFVPRDPDVSSVRRYSFGSWQLDTVTRTLAGQDGVRHELSGAEFRLLGVFLANPQRVLSRVQILDLVCGRDGEPYDRSIDVRISRLRQRLGDDGRAPQIIKTVYGEGYVLGVPVQSE